MNDEVCVFCDEIALEVVISPYGVCPVCLLCFFETKKLLSAPNCFYCGALLATERCALVNPNDTILGVRNYSCVPCALECDRQDLLRRLKEYREQAFAGLNIPKSSPLTKRQEKIAKQVSGEFDVPARVKRIDEAVERMFRDEK